MRNVWKSRYLNYCRYINRSSVIGIFIFILLLFYIAFGGRKAPSYFISVKLAEDTAAYQLAVRERLPRVYNTTVVLLHSDWYDSSIWERLNTLDTLYSLGYRALAIDLPGYGYSGTREGPKEHFDRAVILEHALVQLNATESVLVVPSMSGSYALPIVVRGFLRLKGFVAVAPYSVENFSKYEYSSVKIPTLVVYGVDDNFYGAPSSLYLRNIPNVKVHVMLSAGHACYVDNPDEFHKYLVSFLRRISR